jgi:small subunit ribosomal protein S9
MASEFWWGLGRRKTSVARVRIRPGTGVIEVNGRDLEEYFPRKAHQQAAVQPLQATDAEGQYDVFVNASGGGITGQADAIKLGLARALLKADQAYEEALKENQLLTRDPRMVERKKYGLHKARRGKQYSKR